MTTVEVLAFLEEQRTVTLATNGHDGWPHTMPLWYVVRDGQLWSWTYAKSQKARNMERDPRVTLQVETGEGYGKLRGVMIRAHAWIHRDLDTVSAFATELFRKYTGDGDGPAPEVLKLIRAQAPKRVAVQFVPVAPPVTWDHGKLNGGY
jgi:PPOX class probable F420-dependent enzyme